MVVMLVHKVNAEPIIYVYDLHEGSPRKVGKRIGALTTTIPPEEITDYLEDVLCYGPEDL